MTEKLDNFDHTILQELQKDATLSMDALSERVNLSRNACWRRVRQLEESGVIQSRVALVNPQTVGLGLSVFVLIKTTDYVLRVRVADVKSYDQFYQRLTSQVPIADISASFVMEDIVDTTKLPIPHT